jgi:hypothetical protein
MNDTNIDTRPNIHNIAGNEHQLAAHTPYIPYEIRTKPTKHSGKGSAKKNLAAVKLTTFQVTKLLL